LLQRPAECGFTGAYISGDDHAKDGFGGGTFGNVCGELGGGLGLYADGSYTDGLDVDGNMNAGVVTGDGGSGASSGAGASLRGASVGDVFLGVLAGVSGIPRSVGTEEGVSGGPSWYAGSSMSSSRSEHGSR